MRALATPWGDAQKVIRFLKSTADHELSCLCTDYDLLLSGKGLIWKQFVPRVIFRFSAVLKYEPTINFGLSSSQGQQNCLILLDVRFKFA